MSPAVEIALWWVAFAGTHMGMSSQRLRPVLTRRIGERAFQGVYSAVALAIFVRLVWIYFANKHAGPWLWTLALGPGLRWLVYLGMGVAFTFVASGLVRPSPASVTPGEARPYGIYRITRHPLIMGIALFGGLHLIPNGSLADVAFFGGFAVFALVGCWHQDQRKLATSGDAFRQFYAGTPFLPFTGRDTLQGLRELSPVAIAIGVTLTVGLRWFHASWFGP